MKISNNKNNTQITDKVKSVIVYSVSHQLEK